MTEFFNFNTGKFQNNNQTRLQRVQQFVKNNYPNFYVVYRSDGMIELGEENFTLDEGQKAAIEAQIAAL